VGYRFAQSKLENPVSGCLRKPAARLSVYPEQEVGDNSVQVLHGPTPHYEQEKEHLGTRNVKILYHATHTHTPAQASQNGIVLARK